MTSEERAMLEAVRASPLVGRGSCAVVDECFEDHELVQAFRRNRIETPDQAVDWAVKMEDRMVERGLETSYGEEDAPEVKAAEEWERRKREHGR